MPKVTGPAFSLAAAKSLKKTLTYQKRPSGHAVYPWKQPGGREPFTYSYSQMLQRENIRRYVAAWRALDPRHQEEWDELAKEQGELGTGYHKFIRLKGLYPEFVWILGYDGVNDRVSVPISPSLNLTEWTLESWIYANDISVRQWFFNKGAVTGVPAFTNYSLELNDSRIWAFFENNVGADSVIAKSSVLQSHAWYPTACTFDGTDLIIYINGLEDKKEAQVITPDARDDELRLGQHRAGGGTWGGFLAEQRLWNKALNPQDILIHAKKFRDISTLNSPGINKGNLMAHYPMLTGSGTILKDFSDFANDGAFRGVGEPAWVRRHLYKDIYGIAEA